MEAAALQASTEARISPNETRTATAGACGFETTVARTLDTQGDSDPANDVLPDTGRIDLGWQQSGALQIGGIWALLAAIAGMLRRGPTPETQAADSRTDRLKRTLLTWLPLTLAGSWRHTSCCCGPTTTSSSSPGRGRSPSSRGPLGC